MTPLLVLLFGVSPTTAVGTDLLYASATKTVGSAVHGWRETVDWQVMQRLALGSIPAALFTLMVLNRAGPLSKATQNDLMLGLAAMLALTSVLVLLQKRIVALAGRRKLARGHRHSPRVVLGTVALGALLGTAVSLTSVGAGAIGVTALLLLYPELPMSRIVGTDIAHAVPLTLVAGMGHWIYGDVDGVLLVNLLLGSVPGIIIGSLISSRSPDGVLRPLLGMVLVLSSWQLFLKASRPAEALARHALPAAAHSPATRG